jgi:transposase
MVNSDSAFHCGKQLLYKVQDSVHIGGVEYTIHLFLDTKRKQQEESTLHAFILEIESRVSESDYTRHSDLKIFLDDNFAGWKQYFAIRQQRGMYRLAKKTELIKEATRKFGTLILLTNSRIDSEEALSFYRKKDGVEKLFNSMKNGLDRKRLRVHSRKAMYGILFIDFIALIIYSWIHQRLKSGHLKKTYTMNEVFYELQKLSVVTIGKNQKILTEQSKRQRVIFETFGIPQPTLA